MIFLQGNTLPLLEDLLRGFLSAVPNIAGALLLILLGWLISKFAAKLLRRVLKGVGIDRLAEKLNEIDLVSRSNIRVVPSSVLSMILYYFLFFIFISAAIDVLGINAVSELMNDFLNYLPYLISALIVFVVGLLLADFLRKIVLTTCESLGIPAARFIAAFVFYFLFLNVVMITLDQARINTGFIQNNLSIILAGIVLAFAIGYGLAARPIVANLLAAYYNRQKIQVGDVIAVDGVKGEVVEKDNASLTLQTGDRKVVIPLSKLSSNAYEVFES